MKYLNLNIKYLCGKGDDLEDELSVKFEEVEKLNETLQQTNLKSSSSSLAEELEHASLEIGVEKNNVELQSDHSVCFNQCSLQFSSIEDLKEHRRKIRKEQLQSK